ncbi:MAG: acetyl-CoA carboxylase biotin carboxylase subunit family protein [Planctomycetota bacterium]|jgi:pyruvate/oxaloacetate carboxyltransferase
MADDENKRARLTETLSGYFGPSGSLPRQNEVLELTTEIEGAGFWAVGAWDTRVFGACLSILREDPWVRLRALKEALASTPLLAAMDGRKLFGAKPFPDEVVEAFVKASAEAGVGIFRIFRDGNDVEGLECAIGAAKKAGAHAQACIVYSESPDHTLESFVEASRKFEALGADSLCLRDAGGLLKPFDATRLVRMLGEAVKIPIHLHCGNKAGTACATYLKALEAGASGFDTALSPLAGGAELTPTEGFAAMLSGTDYDTAMDLDSLEKAARASENTAAGLAGPGTTGDSKGEASSDVLGPGMTELSEELGSQNVEDVLSYAFHGESARSFFAFRERGDTPEEELAAVLGSVLARSIHIVPPPATGGAPTRRGNPWSVAGRLDAMGAWKGRGRGR